MTLETASPKEKSVWYSSYGLCATGVSITSVPEGTQVADNLG